jgi:hypothetical protein
MQQRKSRPLAIPSVVAQRGDRTVVSPPPTDPDDPITAPNVIPFAKPRAIAALLDDKKVAATWGSAAKTPDLATPPGAHSRIAKGTPRPITFADESSPIVAPPPAVAAPVAPASQPYRPIVATFPKSTRAPVAAAHPHRPPVAAPQPAPAPVAAAHPYRAPIAAPFAQPAPAQVVAAHPQRAPHPAGAPIPQAPAPFIAFGSAPHAAPAVAPVAPAIAPAVAPAQPEVAPAAPSRWAMFEQLGLRAPAIDPKKWTKHVVNAYRMIGFAILTVIVMVLIGYIATTAFFYVSDSWVVPMAISPTDDKVLSLQQQLAAQQMTRDKTAADLDDAERAIVVQQAFQNEFAKAILSDLGDRKAALERMHMLATAAASTRAQIRTSNSDYASASQQQMAQEWRAGLIDRQQMLAGKFQVAQISSSNLSLAERQAEYEVRAQDLEAQTRSLEALLANTPTKDAMSYDVLKIKQEYETSRLETQKAIGQRDMLKLALDREDNLLKTLKQTSYLRALGDHAQVAFVPYGNLTKVEKGRSLYGCRLGMVICHKVGTVLEVLPGEVQFKHPHKDKMLRGQMVELKMDDASAAEDDVLFVGGRPLFI